MNQNSTNPNSTVKTPPPWKVPDDFFGTTELPPLTVPKDEVEPLKKGGQ